MNARQTDYVIIYRHFLTTISAILLARRSKILAFSAISALKAFPAILWVLNAYRGTLKEVRAFRVKIAAVKAEYRRS